ncbi:iron ABC transporter permease [Roseisolibacter sp. H3M3-2]|uniref:FecCD family ABC transporter permease n=1 Tax=Roseisolibacter sp. H3M3-2 TaxID=3031323 RepID=UPI0023DCE698|nr:iron ABC transporter permease [Roseisolibacter sp. H3M3-2]MDF1502264.1 iron ABC transporter permease [Roseisolibacter sp. H3M3-2]
MPRARWLAGLAALLAAALLGVFVGAVPLAPGAVWDAVRGAGDATTLTIVRELRLPRVPLGAFVGAGTALSGGALQGALRNALAEPYLLGVSGGAAVGAVLTFAAGVSDPVLVPLGAFVGAGTASALVLAIARAGGGRADPRLLLMAGVVVGAFANAAVMVVLADATPDQVRNALWWMMGSVADAGWRQVGALACYAALAGGALLRWGRDLDALALGEEPAAALGVDVDRAGPRVFVAASMLAAASVAAAGLVGFVGLVAPRLARALGVRAHRQLLGAAALFGATLVIGADVAARVVRAPSELPLGAVTALVGVPFFLWRLARAR